MRSISTLPEGYREYTNIDLQNDKKTALIVNLTATAAMIALCVIGHFAFVPITSFFDTDDTAQYFLRFGITLIGYFAYIILHELTHAAVMKLARANKVRFGFTGLYAYAGSKEDYFNKPAYLATALAPLIVWGIIFAVAQIFVPASWFWVVWFLQIGNISGSVGDIYVTAKTLKMPPDVWIRDTGIEMSFYTK